MGKLRVYCLKNLKKPSIYPLGKTPSAPSEKWGTRTFNEGTQVDGESEEDGMGGELCVRGERRLQSTAMG